ncbi:hypothetical protein PYW08_016804 [Mythimna loreyi]|uniref:Uncharacterized protein n=1 Tax=Mythimna loreyi TaxID=667449 RepID=A0ACC2R399_9NEOP|nr:hypothetical protein PYW08_016804 [Mythimna loreyi]
MYNTTFKKLHYVEDMQLAYDAFPDERYVGFMDYSTPVILVRDPQLSKQITIKDFDHFCNRRELFAQEVNPLLVKSLLFLRGDKWREMRTTLTPAFTGSKMKLIFPIMVENSNNIVKYLLDNQSKNIDVEDLSHRSGLDVIASSGFGLQINSLVDRDNEFFTVVSNLANISIKKMALIALTSTCLEQTKKLGVSYFQSNIHNFFINIVASAVEYRKRENVERADMLQLLMETKKEWSLEDLTAQVFFFCFAGLDTSSTTVSMAIHELALHPEIQERVYQECRQVAEDKEITYESLNELKYLDCVINETLRKWTAGIYMDRTCMKTYQLPPSSEGARPYTLKPGDLVYCPINVIHKDANYWPDPDKFDPERFSEENKHNIKPFTFVPFGEGPRRCIAMRFALMEIKTFLFYIILNFKIVKTEKTTDPLKLNPHYFSVKALKGSFVKFQKRE